MRRGKKAFEMLIFVSLIIGFFAAASLYSVQVNQTTWDFTLEKTGCPLEATTIILTPYILKGLLISLVTFLTISFVGAWGIYGLIFGIILFGCFLAGSSDWHRSWYMITPIVFGIVIGFMLRKSSRRKRTETWMF